MSFYFNTLYYIIFPFQHYPNSIFAMIYCEGIKANYTLKREFLEIKTISIILIRK